MSPASDATLAIDAPTDLFILSEVREGWMAIGQDKKGYAVIESVSVRRVGTV